MDDNSANARLGTVARTISDPGLGPAATSTSSGTWIDDGLPWLALDIFVDNAIGLIANAGRHEELFLCFGA